ncbi:alpha/beta hydrolase [Candidatus Woesearchaeota archaeon]|nr:alpha/beta hydrolase [Candidatus Woesearchaeota archaeon]
MVEVAQSSQFAKVNGKLLESRIYYPADPVDLKGAAVVPIGIGGAIDNLSQERVGTNNSDYLAERLANYGLMSVVYSQPGHGNSEGPFSVRQAVDSANYWRKRFGGQFDRVGGLGHSFGAYCLARSAALHEYSSLTLIAMPFSLMQPVQNTMPGLIRIYDLVKGSPLEELFGRVALAGIHTMFARQKARAFITVAFQPRYFKLRLNSAREFIAELLACPDASQYLAQVSADTQVTAAYYHDDGMIYRRLTPEIKSSLEAFWSACFPTATLIFKTGTHNAYENGRIFNSPELEQIIESAARQIIASLA